MTDHTKLAEEIKARHYCKAYSQGSVVIYRGCDTCGVAYPCDAVRAADALLEAERLIQWYAKEHTCCPLDDVRSQLASDGARTARENAQSPPTVRAPSHETGLPGRASAAGDFAPTATDRLLRFNARLDEDGITFIQAKDGKWVEARDFDAVTRRFVVLEIENVNLESQLAALSARLEQEKSAHNTTALVLAAEVQVRKECETKLAAAEADKARAVAETWEKAGRIPIALAEQDDARRDTDATFVRHGPAHRIATAIRAAAPPASPASEAGGEKPSPTRSR